VNAPNRHATALIVADRGILIMGPSGSGKTALALALIRQAVAVGRFARLVADDQVFLSDRAGRLLARAPATIAGLVEVRGLGPTTVRAEAAAVIDLAVALEIPDRAPRMREPRMFAFEGASVGQLVLPARDTLQSALAVVACFKWPPFCT
jgi:serine kinase of HPr protein (carbohydrate metabolism regulator)